MQCPRCQQEMPDGVSCPACHETDRLESESRIQPPMNSLAAPTPTAPGNNPPPGPPSAGGDVSGPGSEKNQKSNPPSGKEKKTYSGRGKGGNRNSRFRNNRINNVFTGDVFNETSGEARRNKKPLADLIKPLPDYYSEFRSAVLPDLESHLNIFKSERLLLLSCQDEALALTAAYHLINKQKGKKQQLEFSLSVEAGHDESLYSFLEEYENEGEEAVILANMLNKAALPFLSSLIDFSLSTHLLTCQLLQINKLRMICIADPHEVEKMLRSKPGQMASKHWHISFLTPLLQHCYPDCWNLLESQLRRQRREGKWPRTDREFYSEAGKIIRSGALPEELDKREESATQTTAPTLVSEEDPIGQTVYYVATYFPEISIQEFDRIVSLLLGERTMTVTVESEEKAADGSIRKTRKEEEKRLLDLWRKSPPDKKIRSCGLIASRESPRTIEFADYTTREAVRQQLEEEHPFFTLDRFRDVGQMGLIFDESEKVATSAINLHLDMLTSDPQVFDVSKLAEGVQYLADVIIYFDRLASAAKSSDPNKPEEVPQIPAHLGLWFQRVGNLLSGMLERPELTPKVEEYFNQLMTRRRHVVVLNLVKKLRMVQGFREMHWIRRLLNEGTEDIRNQTYDYLFMEARRMGFNIHELLSTIGAWLPTDTDDAENYSPSEKYALTLLIHYSIETTGEFIYKTRHYGLWPPRYPLLAASEESIVRSQLRLLTRWLFHPGLHLIVTSEHSQSDLDSIIATLLAEWFFILREHPEGNVKQSRSPDEEAASQRLLQTFLEEIVTETSIPTRKRFRQVLAACWEELMNEWLSESQNLVEDDPQSSRELNRRRNLMYQVVKQFRAMQRTFQCSPGAIEPASRERS